MKNSKLIGAAINAYYEAKGKKIDGFSLDGFLKRVTGFDDKQILEAIEEARFSNEFPDVTVPLAILNGAKGVQLETQANQQWQIFYNMVRYYPVTSFDDPITAYIAQKTIPVGDCKNMSEERFDRVEKRFVNEYKSIRSNHALTESIIDGALDLRSLGKDAKARLVEEGRVKLPLQLTEQEMRAAWRAIAATR